VQGSIEQWKRLSELVATSLGCTGFESPAQKKRVLHYYLPTYFWVRDQVSKHEQEGAKGPCVVRFVNALHFNIYTCHDHAYDFEHPDSCSFVQMKPISAFLPVESLGLRYS
jgi:hypothetical protein